MPYPRGHRPRRVSEELSRKSAAADLRCDRTNERAETGLRRARSPSAAASKAHPIGLSAFEIPEGGHDAQDKAGNPVKCSHASSGAAARAGGQRVLAHDVDAFSCGEPDVHLAGKNAMDDVDAFSAASPDVHLAGKNAMDVDASAAGEARTKRRIRLVAWPRRTASRLMPRRRRSPRSAPCGFAAWPERRRRPSPSAAGL